jgi:hypothetical protein
MAKVYPVLEFLQIHLKNLARMPRFATLKISIQAGIDILAKYSSHASLVDANIVCLGKIFCPRLCNNTLTIYFSFIFRPFFVHFSSIALDPTIKFVYFKAQWSLEEQATASGVLRGIVSHHVIDICPIKLSNFILCKFDEYYLPPTEMAAPLETAVQKGYFYLISCQLTLIDHNYSLSWEWRLCLFLDA